MDRGCQFPAGCGNGVSLSGEPDNSGTVGPRDQLAGLHRGRPLRGRDHLGFDHRSRRQPPGKAQLLFAALLEVVVIVQTVIASASLALGFRPAEFATTIGYLIGIVILIPVAWLWANSERTRFSGVVLAVAAPLLSSA